MLRTALFATGLAAVLTLSAAAQEPHASTTTTPDTPVSVTENKNIQQSTGNGTRPDAKTDTKADQKALHQQEKTDKAKAKSDKAQRKALAAQDKANREAMKTK